MNDLAGFGAPDALNRAGPSLVALEDVPSIEQAAVTPISAVVHLPTAEIVGRVLVADRRASEALPGFEHSKRTLRALPVLKRLGKGGSARLSPLVAADGLGRIAACCTRIEHGDLPSFRPFEAALRI